MTTIEENLPLGGETPPPPDENITQAGPGFLDRLSQKVEDWGNREWFITGVVTLFLLIIITEGIRRFWPKEKLDIPEITAISELSIVEYEEIKVDRPQDSQDLSDKIIEKEKIEKPKPVNWENAVDAAFDQTQRFNPRFKIEVSSDDYPSKARSSNLPKVRIFFTILIGADGKIKAFRIRKIKSPGNIHKPYEKDFIKAARKVIMGKAKLITRPYSVNGVATPFKWDLNMSFTLK